MWGSGLPAVRPVAMHAAGGSVSIASAPKFGRHYTLPGVRTHPLEILEEMSIRNRLNLAVICCYM